MGSTTKNGKSEMRQIMWDAQNGKLGRIIWDGGSIFFDSDLINVIFKICTLLIV